MSSFAENPQKAIDGTVKSGSVDNAFTITVTNPNDRWIAHVSYRFSYAGGSTEVAEMVVLINPASR